MKCILNRDKGQADVCNHCGLDGDEKRVLLRFQSHVHSKEVIVACSGVCEQTVSFNHKPIWVNESEGANQGSEQLFLVLN